MSISLHLFLPSLLLATDDSPWIDLIYIPLGSLEGAYQYIPKYSTTDPELQRSENDGFAKCGLYCAFCPTFSLEGEAFFTCTHRHPWFLNHVKETAKFVFSDDVAGDCLASCGGVSLYEVPTIALEDPAWINQAHFSAEAFLSIGREWSQAPYWETRIFGVFAVGCGNFGSPWVKGKFALCKNYRDLHRFSSYIEAIGGLGSRCLQKAHFKGYGSIRYRAIDGTLEYQYQVCDIGFLGVKGVYRLLSHNAPKNSWIVAIEWTQPFSL